jgi:arylsulfatase A-like enzyme
MAQKRTSSDKPNILVIWGDDIGISNLSCYSDGLMGYRTPNIDRLAEEGMKFTATTENRAAPQAALPSSWGRVCFDPD